MRALLVAAMVLATGACTGSSSPGSGNVPPGPTHAALVAKAALDPCPPSVAGAHVSHGLPDVTLPCLGNGPAVHLAGLRGVPMVVNIWGSWCVPCQAETKYLATVYDALKPRVRFLGVDTEDSTDSALDFAPHVSPPMRYPSVVDDQKKVLVGLELFSAVPSTVFVDAAGHVVHKAAIAYGSAAQLRKDIAHYLGVSS
ncbi:MAG: TlpA family protein disulfide reductase [Frankiaceae bacterium]|nr:TlpA family protein disulfide reductase [Frankiaceae bacterium]MBV9368926.1 TlpA family protein disulfide reductase [Frankiales bacterium]